MAQLPTAFDTRTAPPPREDFDVLPAGEYLALITNSAMKDLKAPKVGQYLELEFTVLDGPAKGRKAWTRLNLVNQSTEAVKIAQRDLNAICEAVGHVGELKDSVLLHNKPLIIRVAVIPAGTPRKVGPPSTNDQNEIKAYKRVDGAAGTTTAPAAAATPATTAAPWGTRAA